MSGNNILIDKEKALQIATDNAGQIYRDLSIYTITAKLENNQWFIDYNINDPTVAGGGPHYIINATTGVIDSFRYEQ